MNRRDFTALFGGVAAVMPFKAYAQKKLMPVIGYLDSGPRYFGPIVAAFQRGLNEAGFIEGQNITVEYLWAEDHYHRLPDLAASLVRQNVDVIVAIFTLSALAAKAATATIPIVFAGVSDPVGMGLVVSLARPGGNVTGFSSITTFLMPKLFELLTELVPGATAIALLTNPGNPVTEPLIKNVGNAARAKGIALHVLTANSEADIDAELASLGEPRPGALVVEGDALFFAKRERIVALTARHAIPAIYPNSEYAAAGGLISYGIQLAELDRQAANYVGRILNGARPADLPVQQPTVFELVINLKTAKELGLTMPPSILVRADEVIE